MKNISRYAVAITAASIVSSVPVLLHATEPVHPAPDNSKVNVRDRNDEAKTADHQMKSSHSATEITRMIRRELTKDSGLSSYAHNVKIITDDSSVTLRGPVHTAEEKAKIGQIAERTASNHAVRNELEIKR